MRMDKGQGLCLGDNAAMCIAASVTKHDNVAFFWLMDLAAAVEDEAKIAFLTSMQMPIRRVGTRIERFAEAGIDENTDNQHAAIDAGAPHFSRMMIGCADPFPRLGDDECALFGFAHLDNPITVTAPLSAAE